MDKQAALKNIRARLRQGSFSLGSWAQIANSEIAEIIGQAGYDWVVADMEHGSFSQFQLPDFFRALELGNTLPIVRLAQTNQRQCQLALDAGAAGIILPKVESREQLQNMVDASRLPPLGSRGVGFCRANLYGKYFDSYIKETEQPLIVAMIETVKGVKNLDSILECNGLDVILVGPYDLSASMGRTGEFDHPDFISVMDRIITTARRHKIPAGTHVVYPDTNVLKKRIQEGYQFLVYSTASIMLNQMVARPVIDLAQTKLSGSAEILPIKPLKAGTT